MVIADTQGSMCTESSAKFIKEKIEENNLNRVVIAACTPKTHEPVFKTILEGAGLNPGMLEFVNIREQVSFVHTSQPEKALQKAKDLVRAAVSRAAFLETISTMVIPVTKRTLVIGGGVAGIQASLDLANDGFEVYLVEKSPTIGGKMAQLDRTFPTDDCSI